MTYSDPLILQVHVPGAEPYELGDEIWQQPLPDAIRAEAEIIADHAGPDLLRTPSQATRPALRNLVIAEMTAALRQAGDTYTAPDGVAYTLADEAQLDLPARQDTLACMSPANPAPIVEEVLRFEDLPVGSSTTRGAIVRWSDGTKARRWPGTATKSSSAKATCWARAETSLGPCTSAETATGCSRRGETSDRSGNSASGLVDRST